MGSVMKRYILVINTYYMGVGMKQRETGKEGENRGNEKARKYCI
jgi:hypothetical protein